MRHLAIISEHASPLVLPDVPQAGRQNEYVAQVAERAVAHGYAVDVFTRRVAPDAAEMIPWRPGVRIVHIDAGPARVIDRDELLPHMGDFAERMLEFVRREQMQYDVMHANYWMSGYVAAIVKRALGIPFVITFHALGKVRRTHAAPSDGFPTARPIIEERVMQEADAILATSPEEEHDLCMHYDAPASRISVVPCGVDLERFHTIPRSCARSSLDLPATGDMLLGVGRLIPQKGFDDLIRAFAQLRRRHMLTPRLVIVGESMRNAEEFGPDELARLRHVAREENVEEYVTFAGACSQEELCAYYCASDVFVTAPRYEPFGLTALEAMACGTPVVGTRVGGLKFSVQHGHTGLLVPPQDPTALADVVARLLKTPEERAILGRQGQQRARAAFSWNDIVSRLTHVYGDVVERSEREASLPATAPVLRIRPHAPAPEYQPERATA
jgi:D-inositol-3-phosphate glycosyltransferase